MLRPVHVHTDEDTADLWARTLLVCSHERSTVTGRELLRRMLLRERKALHERKGPGWIERIEREYYRPKRKPSTTTAPPPAPDSFID